MIAIGTADQPLYVFPIGSDGQSFVLENARTINAGGNASGTPTSLPSVPEKGPQCFRAAGDRHTGPTLLAFPSKEPVHVDQRNVAESTILFLKPLQKPLDVPALIVEGDRGQAAFVLQLSGKVRNLVCERGGLDLGPLQNL